MPQCLYLNKTECAVLATALNATKLSSYPERQQGLVAKVGRRIANFLIDGQTSADNSTTPKKKLIGFAKTRAGISEPHQLLSVTNALIEPPTEVIIDERSPSPNSFDPEVIYSTLRGKK